MRGVPLSDIPVQSFVISMDVERRVRKSMRARRLEEHASGPLEKGFLDSRILPNLCVVRWGRTPTGLLGP